MSHPYAPRTLTLVRSVLLEAAVRTARARLAGPDDPATYYAENARDLLVAVSAVELIDGAGMGNG